MKQFSTPYLIVFMTISISLLSACGGGGGGGGSSTGGSGGATVQGLDLTGVWRFIGIECYDSSFQNLTAAGTASASSAVGTSVVAGNLLQSEDVGNGGCKVTLSRSIVANLQAGNSSGGYGTGTFGATTAAITPGASCTLETSFDMALGSVTPSLLSSTYNQGQALPAQNFEFMINPPYLGLTSLIQVVGRPTDVCFLILQKL